MKLFNYDLLEL